MSICIFGERSARARFFGLAVKRRRIDSTVRADRTPEGFRFARQADRIDRRSARTEPGLLSQD